MLSYGFTSLAYLPKSIYNFFVFLLKKRCERNLLNPDFGSYRNSKVIGWGFPYSNTYKKYLNELFKNEKFYPKSIVINKKFVLSNHQLVDSFIKDGRYIIKYDKGHGGKNIYIVKNIEEIIQKINNSNWILQQVIEPSLYNKHKFDLRIYHFILRYENKYYNILSKVGFCKTSAFEYNPNSSSVYGFLTNVLFNNKKSKVPHMFEFFNFMNKFEKNKEKRDLLIKNIYDVIRNYSKILVGRKEENRNKFKINQNLKAQLMIYGPDIILDKERKPYLLETNCNPGFLFKGEPIYYKQKLMLSELLNNIVIPIMGNKNVNLDNYKGNLLFIERIK